MEESFYDEPIIKPISNVVLHTSHDSPGVSPLSKKKSQHFSWVFMGVLLIGLGLGIASGFYLLNHDDTWDRLHDSPSPTPSEKYNIYTNIDPRYSFRYPDTWQMQESANDTYTQVLFYPGNVDISNSTVKPNLEVNLTNVSFDESEKNFSLVNNRTGYYVTNIKPTTIHGVNGYAYVPHNCPNQLCAKKELIFPVAKKTKTIRISDYSLEDTVFEKILSSFSFI